MSYRDDVEALAQRVKALQGNVSASRYDLTEARRLLADARRRHKLPVLDNMVVAAPCHASWDDMVGDAHTRVCAACDKSVYNVSAMTRAEAEALLMQKEGKLCVRYYRRADGTILTDDCPVGVTRRRRVRRIVAAAMGALSVLGAGAGVLLTMPGPIAGKTLARPDEQVAAVRMPPTRMIPTTKPVATKPSKTPHPPDEGWMMGLIGLEP